MKFSKEHNSAKIVDGVMVLIGVHCLTVFHICIKFCQSIS